MKTATKLFALIAVLSLTCAAMAQDATTAPAAAPLKGRVSKVEGLVITLTARGGAESTVTTDASTKFTLDGKDATLADVKAGQRLTATVANGVATEVTLTAARKRKAATAPAN